MADEITVDAFLDLLGQSDLLSDAQLLSLMSEFRGGGAAPESAQKLADELVRRELLTAWQADMLRQGKHRGFHLGPYRILRPLGQGGMSKVFLAEHEVMHRRCAIKVLPSKYEEDADLLNRFYLEARAIAALDHPNIVRAYDFNKDVRYGKEIHYLVMEYVEGPDLRRMVEEQGPLDFRKAADFVAQAAEGLAHAHAAGFVHRDIKPANLLVDPHGVLKVLDLGLATFTFDAEQSLNSEEGSQSAVGTADYVSPEQVADSRNVDGRADIYSLGHTFYYLLTAHRPFSKPTIMELLMAHRVEQPEPIGKFRSDVPLDLEAIIDKMTAKSPVHRYQTAKELAEKLRTWLRESGSARTYSRISALMAEALRGKQPSPHEKSRQPSGSTGNTELQLASLDEGAIASLGAASDNNQAENGDLTLAEAKGGDHPRAARDSGVLRSKPQSSSSTKLKPVQEGAAPGKTAADDASEAATPPTLQADLLSGPLTGEMMPASPPTAPLPALATAKGSPQHSSRAGSKRRLLVLREFLKTPWPWVGLAGFVILVVLVIMVIVYGSPSTERPVGLPGRVVTGPKQPVRLSPPGTPPKQPSTPLGGATPLPKDQGTSKLSTPPKTTTKPVNGKATTQPPTDATKTGDAKKDDGKKTEPVKPPAAGGDKGSKSESAKPPTPDGDEGEDDGSEKSPAPDKGEAKPPEPKPAPVEEQVDTKELLGNVKTMSITIQGFDAVWQEVVKTQATRAATRMGIDVGDGEPTVMEIKLTASTTKNAPGVELSAELKCPGPKGKVVPVWKKSQKVLKVDPTKLRPGQVSGVLKDKAERFFEQFQNAVRDARPKAEPEPE
jgi:serine/threonine protein kinase